MLIPEPFPPEEGIGNYVYNLSKKLIERGHEISVLTRGGLKPESFEYEEIHVFKVPFLFAYPFHVDIHGIFVNLFLKRIRNELDLLHIHMPLTPPVNTHLPIVSTFHSPHYADSLSIEIADIRHFLIKTLGIIDYRLEKSLISNSNVVSAVSEGVKSDMERYYRINPSLIKVFGNAVSDKFLEGARSNDITKDPFRILFVGRFEYQKGLLDLIDSMKIVVERIPQARLFLIGKGPLLLKLTNKIIDLNLQKQVKIKGFLMTGSMSLIEEYLRASVFVVPSHSEGLATVTLEAMACKTAVVATNVRGLSEVVKSGSTGLLVPKKDPFSLGAAITLLLENPNLREKLASNARKLIDDKYTWDRVTDSVLSSYYTALRWGK
jgi:glycosyltransferase involved in cell wall biosynthesis